MENGMIEINLMIGFMFVAFLCGVIFTLSVEYIAEKVMKKNHN